MSWFWHFILIPEEIPHQTERVLETIQGTKVSICEKGKTFQSNEEGTSFIEKKRDIMLNSANSREKLLQSSYRWLKIKTSMMTIIPDLMIMKIHYWQLTWNPRSLTPIGSDDSKKSWEDEPVFALHKEQPVDFVMNSRPIFRPYVKVILQLSQHKQITLTALIDTRAVSSIIRERCLPKSYHVPTQVSFTAVSRYQFYSHKYTKLI